MECEWHNMSLLLFCDLQHSVIPCFKSTVNTWSWILLFFYWKRKNMTLDPVKEMTLFTTDCNYSFLPFLIHLKYAWKHSLQIITHLTWELTLNFPIILSSESAWTSSLDFPLKSWKVFTQSSKLLNSLSKSPS